MGAHAARGVRQLPGARPASATPPPAAADADLGELRGEVARLQERLGRRPKILVGKPGLDGHSNGAEQIAVRARDSGMDVVYEGIRMTPAQIAASALQEGVHVIGLSILSGSHRELIPAVLDALREEGVDGAGRGGRHHPRAGRAAARACGRGGRLHAQGLRHHAHHARHRGAGGRRRERRRLLRQRLGVSEDGAALGARLRERDLGAAPAALNLLESTTAEDREQSARLLEELSPAALGGEAQGHVIGITGPPGAGKSTLLSALLEPGAVRGARWRCWPSTRARGARAARCSATGRASTSIRPTAAC